MEAVFIPKELESYREKIMNTVQEYVEIQVENGSGSVYQSKVGGKPYFPIEGLEYPQNSEGKYMELLAQINFREVPEIDGYPKEGILQFFISDDDLYGAEFEEPSVQKDFKVIFHENIQHEESKLIKDFSFLNMDKEMLPFRNEGTMIFKKNRGILSTDDYRFPLTFGEYALDDMEELLDGTEIDVYDLFSKTGHRIGGYPFFTQSDPREYTPESQKYDTLLFQIDSDEEIELMWGDCGVCNFFINSEELKNKNFSNVLYNWDCC